MISNAKRVSRDGNKICRFFEHFLAIKFFFILFVKERLKYTQIQKWNIVRYVLFTLVLITLRMFVFRFDSDKNFSS